MNTLFKTKKVNVPTTLADRFIVPPFSVINTHAPYFRERLAMWRDLGLYTDAGRDTKSYDNRRMAKYAGRKGHSGISQFNPVLTEVMYKWFTPHEHSKILDPFAGGITRGGVACMLGHNYKGYDLNEKQLNANSTIYWSLQDKYNIEGSIHYILGDSSNIYDKLEYDIMLTCPPYYNLEKYTNDERDLSNFGSYDEFLTSYRLILQNCYNAMKEDTFAVIVVSDVRDKKTTAYYPLVADTIRTCMNIGWQYYNEIILYNDTGNLAITSGDYMKKARKVGRQHQNVLVFYKGDIKNIKEKFGGI